MSHQLSCVIEGCDAEIDEETEAEVLEKAEAHAKEAHPELELDAETVDTIRSHIKEQ